MKKTSCLALLVGGLSAAALAGPPRLDTAVQNGDIELRVNNAVNLLTGTPLGNGSGHSTRVSTMVYDNWSRPGARFGYNANYVDPNSYVNANIASGAWLYIVGNPNVPGAWAWNTSLESPFQVGAFYTYSIDDYDASAAAWPGDKSYDTAAALQFQMGACIELDGSGGDPNYASVDVIVVAYADPNTVGLNCGPCPTHPNPASPDCCPPTDPNYIVPDAPVIGAFAFNIARAATNACYRVTVDLTPTAGDGTDVIRIPGRGFIGIAYVNGGSSVVAPGVGIRYAGGDVRTNSPATCDDLLKSGGVWPDALTVVGTSDNLYALDATSSNFDPNLPYGWSNAAFGDLAVDANCPSNTLSEVYNNTPGVILLPGAAVSGSPPCPTPAFPASSPYSWMVSGPCAGDVNGDGAVTQDDLDIVLFGFGSCPGDAGYAPGAKLVLECDQCINQNDLDVVLFNFGC